jgi:hypothetical protein
VSTVSDRALLDRLLEAELSDEYAERAFGEMAEWLAGGESRRLSEKQRAWAENVAKAKELIDDEAQNLWSSGAVPIGIVTKKTRGEAFAASILSNRPLAPPRRVAKATGGTGA